MHNVSLPEPRDVTQRSDLKILSLKIGNLRTGNKNALIHGMA
jgi:hypothetical protein